MQKKIAAVASLAWLAICPCPVHGALAIASALGLTAIVHWLQEHHHKRHDCQEPHCDSREKL